MWCVCRHAQEVGVHNKTVHRPPSTSSSYDHVLLMSIDEGLIVWEKKWSETAESGGWGCGLEDWLLCMVIEDKGGSCDLIFLVKEEDGFLFKCLDKSIKS